MIRVTVADQERLVAESLARLVEAESDMQVRGVYSDGTQLMRGLESHDTDVIVIDPAGWVPLGVEFLIQLRGSHPACHVVVVTSCLKESFFRACVRASVKGVISKSAGPKELLDAIRGAQAGKVTLSAGYAVMLMDEFSRQPPSEPGLPPRQLDILRGIVRGMTDREMASELDIAEKTVKNYIHSLFSALDVRTRTQAAVQAIQLGLISTDASTDPNGTALARD